MQIIIAFSLDIFFLEVLQFYDKHDNNGAIKLFSECNGDCDDDDDGDHVFCPKPTIPNGSLTPSDDVIAEGENYEIECNADFQLIGPAIMTCHQNETFGVVPTCAGNFCR